MLRPLRDYQEESVASAHRHLYERNLGGTIIHLATGMGKTRIATEFINRYYDLHTQRVMFVVHTVDLVLQTYFAFLELHPEWSERCYTKFGYPGIGIVMGKYTQDNSRIIIGTPQTLSGTEKSSERLEEVLQYGSFDLIIIDEAHYGASQSYLNLCETLLPAKRLGLTATPMRSDGLALRQPLGTTKEVLFDTICISRNVKWGIANGYLCPILPPLLVETNIALPGGRGNYEERAKLIDVENWAELVVDAYEQHGEERLAAYFLPSVEHSKRVRDEFAERGYQAVHVDGDSLIFPDGAAYTGEKAKSLRKDAWAMGYTGEAQIYCNYNVLTHGWDMPPIACIGLARPTDSPVLIAQIIGRGTRLDPSKENLLVLDYALKDIPIMLSGTLTGYTWDEKRQEMVEDTEAEVETLVDGIDLRDLKASDELVDGNGIVTRVGNLFRKMGEAWYHSDEVMTLGLSENHMLLIHIPNHTLANAIEQGLRNGQEFLLENPDHDNAKQFYQDLLRARDLSANFSLWHVHRTAKGQPYAVDWVAFADSAELVFDYALPVISEYEQESISKKKRQWRRQPASEVQLQLLRRYGIMSDVDKGTASQLISHHISLENVRNHYQYIIQKAGKYGVSSTA